MPIPAIEPLAPRAITTPVTHPGVLWELKHDGWRALLYVDRRRGRFISRTGRDMPRFQWLADQLAKALQLETVVLDGELVCLDADGRSHFAQLSRRDANVCFYAFDLLWSGAGDQRQVLWQQRQNTIHALWPMGVAGMLIASSVSDGEALFAEVCRLDLEGVVGKAVGAPYALVRGRVPWVKVLNPDYTQKRGRAEAFKRRPRPKGMS